MEELQLKYVEIIFDKEKPQFVGTDIHISSEVEGNIENLEYKFIVGKDGIWNTIQEFSYRNECVWSPEFEGNYIVMVQAREKYGKKSLDYLAKEDYLIIKDKYLYDDNTEEIYTENSINYENNDINKNMQIEGYIDNKNIVELRNEENIILEEPSFNEVISNGMILLEASEVTIDEKKILEGMSDMGNLKLANEDQIKENDIKYIDQNTDLSILKSKDIIEEVYIDKKDLVVGDKCFIQVRTKNKEAFLYRFYIRRYRDWDIIRDYTADSMLRYTANEEGEKEFLVQCKSVDSNENFDDYKTIKMNVKALEKIEITNFESLSKELIVGNQIAFKVETNSKENREILYKFYKISNDGKSTCIQDYSTQNQVSYIENEHGQYRILCLTKDILSNSEYDDRAILVYKVKPYKEINIKSFSADLNSPQVNGSKIKFKVEAQGGKKLLYRYKVKGEIEEDTGFINESKYIWSAKEPGEYEIIVFVKDKSFNGDYEATKKLDFTIEKKGCKPIKILDVVVDKEKRIIINEPVNILVSAEGGTHINYSFIVRRNGKVVEKLDYNKSNWINFIPKDDGEYEVEVLLRDKYSNKSYDAHTLVYLKAMDYLPGEIDYIIMPHKETRLVGDIIELECIIQNTMSVLVKYETKINGQLIEETEFSKNKRLRFIPKIAGKYTIIVYSKNIKCRNEYDSKKEVNLYVSDAAPVINTQIITNNIEGRVNEEFTFEVISRGGREVCYEFYLMDNNEWKKVQSYSRKHYYSFIPFKEGEYKILALAKSYYKKVNYEDYDEIKFQVKGIVE